jgi:hypothetical protein
MNPMRCHTCEAEAVPAAAYCTRCGASLSRSSATLGEPEPDDPRLVVSLTPRQVLAYGLATSLVLFILALAAIWVPTLHLGPGIDTLCGLLAWVAAALGAAVQVGATATVVRMLGAGAMARSPMRGGLVGERAEPASLPESPGERLLDPPPSVVEHTTFRLTVPGSVRRARTTADQG